MIGEDIINTNDSELIMLYREEDENAKNILYLKYKFIIDILIKKYLKIFQFLNIDYQEVYSECTVAFSDSLKNYQENKNASLPTFITVCIERRLRGIIRKYNQDKYKAFQDTYSLDFVYEDNESSLLEIISDSEYDPLENLTEREDYEELITLINSKLTEKEREVFTLMIRGLGYQEIAKILDNSPKQIDNAIQRIKHKIKNIRNIESDK